MTKNSLINRIMFYGIPAALLIFGYVSTEKTGSSNYLYNLRVFGWAVSYLVCMGVFCLMRIAYLLYFKKDSQPPPD